NGELLHKGRLGEDVTLQEGQESARICILNILASLKKEIVTLEKIKQVIKVTGFIASTPNFIEQGIVMNSATDLINDILGDKGTHARSAIGTAVMPKNAPVEIE